MAIGAAIAMGTASSAVFSFSYGKLTDRISFTGIFAIGYLFMAAGFLMIVTTNQPGLSRGYQSRSELDLMHTMIRRMFPVDDILGKAFILYWSWDSESFRPRFSRMGNLIL